MSELLLRYFCLKPLRHLMALNQGPCAWLHLVLLFFLISPSFISPHSWCLDPKLAVKSHILFIILFRWFCALSVQRNKPRQPMIKERTWKLSGIKNKWLLRLNAYFPDTHSLSFCPFFPPFPIFSYCFCTLSWVNTPKHPEHICWIKSRLACW